MYGQHKMDLFLSFLYVCGEVMGEGGYGRQGGECTEAHDVRFLINNDNNAF